MEAVSMSARLLSLAVVAGAVSVASAEEARPDAAAIRRSVAGSCN
jgi:hypothetical protein